MSGSKPESLAGLINRYSRYRHRLPTFAYYDPSSPTKFAIVHRLNVRYSYATTVGRPELKGTQAWDNFEFFFDLLYIKSLYALRKLLKKNFLLFLRFSPEFRCSNISAVTEHTRNQILLMSYPKNFFFKIFTLVLLDGFLDGFWKFRLFIVKISILFWYFWVFFENYSMRMLSRRGNNFIACWAYAKPISSHTEHTRNEFPRMLSLR